MPGTLRRPILLACFVVSGACSLIYQVVWLRQAMAAFGVNAAITAQVLSVFMAGLALGSWLGGRRWPALDGTRALAAYAASEGLLGVAALAVPRLFAVASTMAAGSASTWGSGAYFLHSGIWLSFTLLPPTIAMGATLPLAMRALREARDGERSFSALYLANVVGATTGTLLSAFVLIELLGLRGTLRVAVGGNLAIAAVAWLLFWIRIRVGEPHGGPDVASGLPIAAGRGPRRFLVALFTTGFISMALEVVWVRQFGPYVGNLVYAFAGLLAVYLVATAAGSALYRRLGWRDSGALSSPIWLVLPLAAVASAIAADPGAWPLGALAALPGGGWVRIVRVVLGVAPFSLAVGYLTPMLVDRWSGGDARRAGPAYALNVVGCILGPLVSGFVLLPAFGERGAAGLLSATLAALAVVLAANQRRRLAVAAASTIAFAVLAFTSTFEDSLAGAVVRRDATATVAALPRGARSRLLVNGIGMTELTPITKMMTHLPLALRPEPPRNGTLVVCLGMGTSLRSALAWGAPAVAVELVPSVVELAPRFHPDAPGIFAQPLASVVVDDGRRYLERETRLFDAIVVDPPPPVQAASSSLLYSLEFYRLAARRLAPGGVFQQWFPGGDPATLAATLVALGEVFPHVRAFRSIEGWGVHLLASREPLAVGSAAELAARLPPAAAADLVAWTPGRTPEQLFATVLGRELNVASFIGAGTKPLVDDRPINEYFFLRRLLGRSAD